MPTFIWNSVSATPTRVNGFSDAATQRCNVSLPQARIANNGNRPILITSTEMYLSGNGASRNVSIQIGNNVTSTFSVASSGTAALTSMQDITAYYSNTPQTVSSGFNTNGNTYFGNSDKTGITISPWSLGSNRTLWGRSFYIQVPTGPTQMSASNPTTSGFQVNWQPPSDNGGGEILNYLVQASTSSSFSTIAKSAIVESSERSYVFDDLESGTKYFARVAAGNEISQQTGTPRSAYGQIVESETLVAGDPPTWSTESALPSATLGVSYFATVFASGAISYSKVSGTDWISVSESGSVFGVPNLTGTAEVTIRATADNDLFVDREFSISVLDPVAAWTDESISTAVKLRQNYSDSVSAQYVQSISISGSLPSGLTSALSSSGNTKTLTISGAPEQYGSFPITISAVAQAGLNPPALSFSLNVSIPGRRAISGGTTPLSIFQVRDVSGFRPATFIRRRDADGTWKDVQN